MNKLASCYARLDGNRLAVGNGEFERTWEIGEGAPEAASILDKVRRREWTWQPPYRDVFRRSILPLAGRPTVHFASAEDDRNGCSEKHLLATIRLAYPNAELTWTHRVWPGLPIILSQFTVRLTAPAAPAPVESNFDNGTGGLHILMVDDRIDTFGIEPMHLAYRAAQFSCQTDWNDNHVREKHAFTYNKERIRESGHFIHFRDRDSGDGLLALKIAPTPGEQLNYPGYDFAYCGKTFSIAGSGISDADLQAGAAWPAYASAVGVTDGSDAAGMELFYRLDRQRHKPVPERNFNILTNNWGSGNGSKAICEKLMLAEIDTAARLGLTHVQLDAGWQQGIQHGWLPVEERFRKSVYEVNPNYWEIHAERFPNRFTPLVERAREKGIRLGIWFAPDMADDYACWEKDRDIVLGLWRDWGFDAVKIDGVSLLNKRGEKNLLAFLNGIFNGSNRRICINFDITGGGGSRLGHFYETECVGNLFVENRYAHDRTYYPYRTTRSLWHLCRYFPSYRLHLEFVDAQSKSSQYAEDDPFRPAAFGTEYSCAAVLFANPLCWMETQHLAERDKKALAGLIHAYRPHQRALLSGRVFPIGEEPSGRAWTGFQSVTGPGEGYLMVLREITDRRRGEFALHGVPPGARLQLERIAGKLSAAELKVDRRGVARVALPRPASYGFVRYRAV